MSPFFLENTEDKTEQQSKSVALTYVATEDA
jgi:hypothetical protein